jgi:hypothetical protein
MRSTLACFSSRERAGRQQLNVACGPDGLACESMATHEDTRHLPFLIGTGSAVDISGRLAREADVLPRLANGLDPSSAVASDMARVIHTFGRAARCARSAVDAGRRIDDLPTGCTLNGSNGHRTSVRTLRQSTLARFSR